MLTARQKQVLEVVKKLIRETGYPPTRAELAKFLGVKSCNGIQDHLTRLQAKGYVELSSAARGIKLTSKAVSKLQRIRFDCDGSFAPAYSCSLPGNNTGQYYKAEDVDALLSVHGLSEVVQ